jgi:hypothetical protein
MRKLLAANGLQVSPRQRRIGGHPITTPAAYEWIMRPSVPSAASWMASLIVGCA